MHNIEMKHTVYLELIEHPELPPYYWKFILDPKDVNPFRDEIEIYNRWIKKFLYRGLAPDSSYEDPEVARQIFLAQNKSHWRTFERPTNRNVYEVKCQAGFTLCDMDDEDEDLELLEAYRDIEKLKSYKEIIKTEFLSLQTLKDIITKPYGEHYFRMGYKVLPMTERIINQRINI